MFLDDLSFPSRAKKVTRRREYMRAQSLRLDVRAERRGTRPLYQKPEIRERVLLFSMSRAFQRALRSTNISPSHPVFPLPEAIASINGPTSKDCPRHGIIVGSPRSPLPSAYFPLSSTRDSSVPPSAPADFSSGSVSHYSVLKSRTKVSELLSEASIGSLHMLRRAGDNACRADHYFLP